MVFALALLVVAASALAYLYLAALRRGDALAAERDLLRAQLAARDEDRARPASLRGPVRRRAAIDQLVRPLSEALQRT